MQEFRGVLAAMCLKDMDDVEEDAPLLEQLDQEEKQLLEEMWDERMLELQNEIPFEMYDYDISDEDLEKLRREAEEGGR